MPMCVNDVEFMNKSRKLITLAAHCYRLHLLHSVYLYIFVAVSVSTYICVSFNVRAFAKYP